MCIPFARLNICQIIDTFYKHIIEVSLLHCLTYMVYFFLRWASEQAKARELGDVVEFIRDCTL